MSFHLLSRKAKSIAMQFELRINQKFKRQYIAKEIHSFNIETSGICNLKCRFCAYPKKNIPKTTMSQNLFEKSVNEAVSLGYSNFELTPCTGDIFMDGRFLKKLLFLEQTKGVVGYSFFTNLIVPNKNSIFELSKLKKLRSMVVSVYGHDEESFLKITRSTSHSYRRLLSNLDFLLDQLNFFSFDLGIGFRSEYKALNSNSNSDLKRILERFKRAGVNIMESHGIFNNWGGYVTQNDVIGLDMGILETNFYPKIGACSKIFDSVQVTSSGIVNACNCRDVDNQLTIGNINEKHLSKILSPLNPLYKKIIDEQENNEYRSVCKNCDYYRSIYHQPQSYRRNNIATISINDFISNPFPRDRK